MRQRCLDGVLNKSRDLGSRLPPNPQKNKDGQERVCGGHWLSGKNTRFGTVNPCVNLRCTFHRLGNSGHILSLYFSPLVFRIG